MVGSTGGEDEEKPFLKLWSYGVYISYSAGWEREVLRLKEEEEGIACLKYCLVSKLF